jgi:riboflavin kinase/FMN adenylyltransferase
VVGSNHYFGHNGEKNYKSLYRAKERFAFRVEEIPEQEIQHETVSSTRIRSALEEGNIQRANAYLEHNYMISANLEAGCGHTKAKNGYPCLQTRVNDPLKLLPPAGIYAASFRHRNRQEKALVDLEEDGLRVYPLDTEDVPGDGERTLYLHLRMCGPVEQDLSSLFDSIRELIY